MPLIGDRLHGECRLHKAALGGKARQPLAVALHLRPRIGVIGERRPVRRGDERGHVVTGEVVLNDSHRLPVLPEKLIHHSVGCNAWQPVSTKVRQRAAAKPSVTGRGLTLVAPLGTLALQGAPAVLVLDAQERQQCRGHE